MSTINVTRYAIGATAACLSVVVLASCSSSGGSGNAGMGPAGMGHAGAGSTAPVTAGSNSSNAGSGLRTQSTSIGTVTTDASGHTLYELVGGTTANTKCTGTCLSVWPAAMANGKQVVLQGHPAYTFSGDSAAGQVNGQGAKDQWGTWLALDSTGAPIAKTAASPGASKSSSSSSGSGDYGY